MQVVRGFLGTTTFYEDTQIILCRASRNALRIMFMNWLPLQSVLHPRQVLRGSGCLPVGDDL